MFLTPVQTAAGNAARLIRPTRFDTQVPDNSDNSRLRLEPAQRVDTLVPRFHVVQVQISAAQPVQ